MFCNVSCSTKHRHATGGKKEIREAKEQVESGNPKRLKTGIEILKEAANNETLDWTSRINAAKALAPYESKKAESLGGKKAERAENAKGANVGRFSPAQPPRLVNGGKG